MRTVSRADKNTKLFLKTSGLHEEKSDNSSESISTTLSEKSLNKDKISHEEKFSLVKWSSSPRKYSSTLLCCWTEYQEKNVINAIEKLNYKQKGPNSLMFRVTFWYQNVKKENSRNQCAII